MGSFQIPPQNPPKDPPDHTRRPPHDVPKSTRNHEHEGPTGPPAAVSRQRAQCIASLILVGVMLTQRTQFACRLQVVFTLAATVLTRATGRFGSSVATMSLRSRTEKARPNWASKVPRAKRNLAEHSCVPWQGLQNDDERPPPQRLQLLPKMDPPTHYQNCTRSSR